ncbi:MAG: 5-(carboxyamino)imidazole ribonucleotide synthase [Verrucomicrobiales bacterium]|nr:5-(carboxyamino)imidazole ribonucleotide synthase [Verrucomicrobiales bacterium]
MNNKSIGILGGGQLGRMLVKAASDFGLSICAMDSDGDAPVKDFIRDFKQGDIRDYEQVMAFGKSCDLLTIEIENVNTEALRDLEAGGLEVFPQPHIIELIKDKSKQKQFYRDKGIASPAFEVVNSKEEVKALAHKLPFVNKLAVEGYDGRGVQVMRVLEDLEKGFDAVGIVEDFVPFEKELSVMVARNQQGEVAVYPAVEMVAHAEHNLVEHLFSPAEVSAEVEAKAEAIAVEVIEKLGMVGLLAVELFVTKAGEVMVNEVAPRPHNSGHQTIEANITSQYEQHLRAILGLPLGATEVLIPSVMVNLLGEEGYVGSTKYVGLEEVLREAGVHVHLYGKKQTRPYRKMGHVTIVDQEAQELKRKADFVKKTLKVIA